MPGKKAKALPPGRAKAIPRPVDLDSTQRATAALASAQEQLEREHVGSGGNAHAVTTTKRAGFAPALTGRRTDVLTGDGTWVDLATLIAELTP